jgi:thioredoxin reductase (NADPH)
VESIDLAIIGCGPAGLSAAINAKIRNKEVLLLGSKLCSPALHRAHQIDNYLGFYDIPGDELRRQFLKHAAQMGVNPDSRGVTAIYPMGDYFEIQFKDSSIQSKTLILTTGVAIAKPLPGEDTYLGKGISYCATCDGNFFRAKRVALVSDEAQGEEEANFLAELAQEVFYVAAYTPNPEALDPKITIIQDKAASFSGDLRLREVRLKSGVSLLVDGCFIHKEQLPLTRLVPGLELEDKHIKVDRNMATSIPGLFAAGDVTGRPYQLAKAVGEGQIAALSAVRYLDPKRKV